MKSTIGGPIDYAALVGSADTNRMRHFHALPRQQQIEAVHRLATSGMSEHSIARAAGLSVEMIRRLLEPSS